MRKVVLIINLLCLLPESISAQTGEIVLAPYQFGHWMYATYSYPMEILYKDRRLHAKDYQAEVITGHAICTKDYGYLMIHPTAPGPLTILIRNKKGRELFHQEFYAYTPAPHPVEYMLLAPGIIPGWINRELLSTTTAVMAHWQGCWDGIRDKIDSFSATVSIGDSKGCMLTEDIKQLIRKTTGGDRVEFHDFYMSIDSVPLGKLDAIADYDINYEDPEVTYLDIVTDFRFCHPGEWYRYMDHLNYDSIYRVFNIPLTGPIHILKRETGGEPHRSTNCEGERDDCVTFVFSDNESLSKEYSYVAFYHDISASKWYNNDTLLADICYSDTGFSYKIYWRNGRKRQEGVWLYQLGQDTITAINPVTLEEEQRVINYGPGLRQHLKDGVWRYYNEQGDQVKEVVYKKDKEVSEIPLH